MYLLSVSKYKHEECKRFLNYKFTHKFIINKIYTFLLLDYVKKAHISLLVLGLYGQFGSKYP